MAKIKLNYDWSGNMVIAGWKVKNSWENIKEGNIFMQWLNK